jgi:pilus assembly protein TadC
VIKISERFRYRIRKTFPDLEDKLHRAFLTYTPEAFIKKITILSLIFAGNMSVIFLIISLKYGVWWVTLPFFFFTAFAFWLLFMQIPQMRIAKIRHDIEADIFVPARMLLTLLESGASVLTALEKVAFTNAKSSKYFGIIASKIYLGKPLGEAIEEAIRYTPSESFRKVLQPIRKSLKTGTDIQKSLNSVLEDLVKDKSVEIERYEKRLGALSLFYMLFGVIIPAVSCVLMVILLSVGGLEVDFFPFLFILLLITLIVQFVFIKAFQGIRPLMRI